MIDESMDKEQMALPPEPWEFRSKPTYQRLIIMLGGVTVNFILAFIIYIGMAFAYGDTYIANSDLQDGLMIENQAMQMVLKLETKSLLQMAEKLPNLTMTST
jgi:regulator of sigma E protease